MKQQIEHIIIELYRAQKALFHDLHRSTIGYERVTNRALYLLNGGAAIVLLAFIAVLSRQWTAGDGCNLFCWLDANDLAWTLWAIACWAFGLILAAASSVCGALSIRRIQQMMEGRERDSSAELTAFLNEYSLYLESVAEPADEPNRKLRRIHEKLRYFQNKRIQERLRYFETRLHIPRSEGWRRAGLSFGIAGFLVFLLGVGFVFGSIVRYAT